MTLRNVWTYTFLVICFLGWSYAILHSLSTFKTVRARQFERRAEALSLVDFCETTNSNFYTFANCLEAKRELDNGGTLVLALEETFGFLLAEAFEATQRRTRDALVTLGFGGLFVVASLGILLFAADRTLSGYLLQRKLMVQYREFSDASAVRNQIHVPVRMLSEHED